LINEILDLAKIESGRMSISLESVSLASVLGEVKGMAAPIAEKYGIELFFTENCPGNVHADYTRLKQVFLNLISNAIKYNRKNGRVTVYCKMLGQRIRVCIEDTGRGIAPEQREGLFAPFNRLGAEGSDIEGTGIGMMITTQFAAMMDAEVDFESVVGQGSTFWVEMDLLDHGQRVDAGATAEMEVSQNQLIQDKLKVLYIEDNPANMRFMQQVLARHDNYSMLEAATPSVGLQLAVSEKPHIILLDLNLPEMDGYEVLRNLKQNPQTAEIPVIAVTANAMAADVSRGLQAGFYDYITKPVNIQILLKAMREATGQPGEL
jgi:CheY-like chemotaxis protein